MIPAEKVCSTNFISNSHNLIVIKAQNGQILLFSAQVSALAGRSMFWFGFSDETAKSRTEGLHLPEVDMTIYITESFLPWTIVVS